MTNNPTLQEVEDAKERLSYLNETGTTGADFNVWAQENREMLAEAIHTYKRLHEMAQEADGDMPDELFANRLRSGEIYAVEMRECSADTPYYRPSAILERILKDE